VDREHAPHVLKQGLPHKMHQHNVNHVVLDNFKMLKDKINVFRVLLDYLIRLLVRSFVYHAFLDLWQTLLMLLNASLVIEEAIKNILVQSHVTYVLLAGKHQVKDYHYVNHVNEENFLEYSEQLTVQHVLKVLVC